MENTINFIWLVIGSALMGASLALLFFFIFTRRLKKDLQSKTDLFSPDEQNHDVSDDRFRIALNAAPNGMIMVDETGTIVIANKKMEEIFRYEQKDLIGSKVEKLIPQDISKKHVDYRKSFINKPAQRSMGVGRDLFGIRKDGSSVPLEIGLTPIKTPTNMYVVASVIDITERRQAQKRLEEQEQLKKENYALLMANRFKSQFVSNVSHEIRNPLNSLVLLTQQLMQNKEKNLSKNQLDNLNVMNDSIQDLSNLVNDLLDHSKVEKGLIKTSPEKILIKDIVHKIHYSYQSECREMEIDFLISSEFDEKDIIFVDKYRLEQILRNVIGNAVKFTNPGGSVSVIFKSELDSEEQKWLVIEVSDTGPGISTQDLDIIFDRFTRMPKNKELTEGAGLGLTISKQLLSLLSGKIEVLSQVGIGSTFIVHIPFLRPIDENKAPRESYQEQKEIQLSDSELAQLKNCKILIVDDDLRNIFALRQVLLHFNMEVEQAQSAFQALEKIRENKNYSIILLDIMMPEMDGIELMAKLKKEPSIENTQVIGMSGHFSRKQDDYDDIGFASFLPKPINFRKLINVLLELTK